MAFPARTVPLDELKEVHNQARLRDEQVKQIMNMTGKITKVLIICPEFMLQRN